MVVWPLGHVCPSPRERTTWRAGDICQNSAWDMVGALQIFREGEGAYRRVARPGSCPRRTLTSTQRKPIPCDCPTCIEVCVRGGGRGATSRPLLLHGEDAESRDSIHGPKRCLPRCAREQRQQREALRAPPPPPPGLATPSLDTAARLSPDLRGAAPPPPAGSVSPEGHRQSPGGKALAGAGDRSGQAASPARDGGAAVPAALSAARCPLTPLTRCGQAELPRPAWHPCPCPAPPPHRRRREGAGLAGFNYNGSKDVTSGAATCHLPPPGPWVESDD